MSYFNCSLLNKIDETYFDFSAEMNYRGCRGVDKILEVLVLGKVRTWPPLYGFRCRKFFTKSFRTPDMCPGVRNVTLSVFSIEKGWKIVMTVTGSSSFNLTGDRNGYKDFSFFV